MKMLKKVAIVALLIGAKQISAMNEQELATYRQQLALEEAAEKAAQALQELSGYNGQMGRTLYLLKNWEKEARAGNDQEYAKSEVTRFLNLMEDMQTTRAEMCAKIRNDLLKNNIFLKEPNHSVNISQGQGWTTLDYNSKKMREDIERECKKKIEPMAPISRTEEWD